MKKIETNNKILILYIPVVIIISIILGGFFLKGFGAETDEYRYSLSLYNVIFAGGEFEYEMYGVTDVIFYKGGVSTFGCLSVICLVLSGAIYVSVMKDSFHKELADPDYIKIAALLMIISGVLMIFYNKIGTAVNFYELEEHMSYPEFAQLFDMMAGAYFWIIGSIVTGCVSLYFVTVDDLKYGINLNKERIIENSLNIDNIISAHNELEEKVKEEQNNDI